MSENKYPTQTMAARRQASSNYYYRNREACRERARQGAAKRRANKKLEAKKDASSDRQASISSASGPPQTLEVRRNIWLNYEHYRHCQCGCDKNIIEDYEAEFNRGNHDVANEIVDEYFIGHHLLHSDCE
ncbi:hypothetical protein FPV67DRAFT_1448943 [Lyophyllum atratum]|nr:hypothetical protein FPV67DRAFT_1449592 [Lyophyllum atratum]KAF8069138.1 hypothetical protein FPV67DRAFT_1448943 [Lyophyllum atratum]